MISFYEERALLEDPCSWLEGWIFPSPEPLLCERLRELLQAHLACRTSFHLGATTGRAHFCPVACWCETGGGGSEPWPPWDRSFTAPPMVTWDHCGLALCAHPAALDAAACARLRRLMVDGARISWPPAVDRADVAWWQQRLVRSSKVQAAVKRQVARLEAFGAELEAVPQRAEWRPVETRRLDTAELAELDGMARELNVTRFDLLVTFLAVLLKKAFKGNLVIAIPQEAGFTDMLPQTLGCFTDHLLLCVDVPSQQRVGEVARVVHAALQLGRRDSAAPTVEVQREFRRARSGGKGGWLRQARCQLRQVEPDAWTQGWPPKADTCCQLPGHVELRLDILQAEAEVQLMLCAADAGDLLQDFQMLLHRRAETVGELLEPSPELACQLRALVSKALPDPEQMTDHVPLECLGMDSVSTVFLKGQLTELFGALPALKHFDHLWSFHQLCRALDCTKEAVDREVWPMRARLATEEDWPQLRQIWREHHHLVEMVDETSQVVITGPPAWLALLLGLWGLWSLWSTDASLDASPDAPLPLRAAAGYALLALLQHPLHWLIAWNILAYDLRWGALAEPLRRWSDGTPEPPSPAAARCRARPMSRPEAFLKVLSTSTTTRPEKGVDEWPVTIAGAGRALATVYTAVSALCAGTVLLRLLTAKFCHLPFHLRHAAFLLLLLLLFVGRVASDIWELGGLAEASGGLAEQRGFRWMYNLLSTGPVVIFLTIFLVLLYHLTCVLHSISLAKQNLEAAYSRSVAFHGERSLERSVLHPPQRCCCRPRKTSLSCFWKIMLITIASLWVLFFTGYAATLLVQDGGFQPVEWRVCISRDVCRCRSVLAFKGAFRAVRTVVKTTDGAAMEQRFTLNKLGRKVRATLNLRGKEEPPSRTGSASPISKPSSPVPEVHDALPPLSAGTSNLTSPEGLLVRAHPFFLGTRKSFREQLALALEPLANVEADQEVALEPWEEKVWEVLVPRGEPTAAPSSSKVLLKQGEAVPWQLRGIILATEENVKNLQVLYQKTLISEDLEETFEIALDLMQESPFTVRLTAPTSGFYFLSWEKLNELRDLFPEDHKKLVDRARKMLTSVMNSWVQKFYARCFPRLFSYVSQERGSGLDGTGREALRVSFGKECGLLDKTSARHLQLLSPHMDAMRSIAMICARDEVIVRESELGEEMFVLALGKCKVLRSGNDHPVSRLHPGSVFGGQAVLGISQTRKETVMADTVCDVRALSRKALLRVLEKFPEEEERILAIVEAHSQSRKAASTALEQASAGEGGFSQDFIRMLVDNMFEQPFMVNQAILVQGTPGTHLVVLVHGIVEIEANGMVVATVNAPGIFGERGLLVSGSRSGATVRCTTVAECMMLPVDGPSTPVIRQLYEADMKSLGRLGRLDAKVLR
eukprot:g20432.t1